MPSLSTQLNDGNENAEQTENAKKQRIRTIGVTLKEFILSYGNVSIRRYEILDNFSKIGTKYPHCEKMRQKRRIPSYYFYNQKQIFFQFSLFLMVSTASPQNHNRCLPPIRMGFMGMDKC